MRALFMSPMTAAPILKVRASRAPRAPRAPAVPNAVLATLIFVATEAMYFASLLSAYMVIRSHEVGGWRPPGDVRLPVAATAVNTAILLTSGVLMLLAVRAQGRAQQANQASGQALRYWLGATVLGTLFVVFQGYEWVRLAALGLTLTSGIFGSVFFLLIGSHGVHALGGVLVMLRLLISLARGELSHDAARGMAVFWTFVVGLWPLLYALVYF